jgi:hypothetical protein
MARRPLKIASIAGIVVFLIALSWIALEIWFGLTKAR